MNTFATYKMKSCEISAAIEWEPPTSSGYNLAESPLGRQLGNLSDGQLRTDPNNSSIYQVKTKFGWEPLFTGDYIVIYSNEQVVKFSAEVYAILFTNDLTNDICCCGGPDSGWVELELLNGWTGELFYRQDGNSVDLQGSVNASAATNVKLAQLPAGLEPYRTFSKIMVSRD